jgi:transposase
VPPARSAKGLGKVEKVRDIVGLYLNPPDKAVVLCVNEKTQIQALDRTQPLLPMGLGYVEGVTHDYIRHGTTTLFAALDVATGAVIAECKPRHRHQEFLSFLRRIDKEIPPELDVHLIVDNDCTHKHAVDRRTSAQRSVRSWLAQRPRFHVHSTPPYASWLNQEERWFGIITQRAIWRGSFSSVLPGGFRAAVGADHQNRALHRQLQQGLSSFPLDCNCGFDPGEAPAALLANFWDMTLGSALEKPESGRKCYTSHSQLQRLSTFVKNLHPG